MNSTNLTDKDFLRMSGFSDTPEGRAAFYKQFPTKESFDMQMRMGGKMPCMNCGGTKYAQGGILDERHYRDAAFNHIANQTPVFVRAYGNGGMMYQEGGESANDQKMQLIVDFAMIAAQGDQEKAKQIVQQIQEELSKMTEAEKDKAYSQMFAAIQEAQQSAQEEQAEGPMSNPGEEQMEQEETGEETQEPVEETGMRQGGIHLDPAKRGTFKAQASRMNMGLGEAASAILNAPEGKYSPEMRRKANFYQNFVANRKQEGGVQEGGTTDGQQEKMLYAIVEAIKGGQDAESIYKELLKNGVPQEIAQQMMQYAVEMLKQSQQEPTSEMAYSAYGGSMKGDDIEEEDAVMNDDELIQARYGGIPERYRKMGFNKIGVKRQSTRPGKKWMVLARKGDKYKIIHGGYKGMQDFHQHHSEQRRENFWNRMGGKDSAKAKDPFSPLYWHKRFGTWADGGMIPKYQTGTAGTSSFYDFQDLQQDNSDNTAYTGIPTMNAQNPMGVNKLAWDVTKIVPQYPNMGTDSQPTVQPETANPKTKDSYRVSPNFHLWGPKAQNVADLDYSKDSTMGKMNRAAANAVMINAAGSPINALPDKGLLGLFKGAANIAGGLGASFLGYSKLIKSEKKDTMQPMESRPMTPVPSMPSAVSSNQTGSVQDAPTRIPQSQIDLANKQLAQKYSSNAPQENDYGYTNPTVYQGNRTSYFPTKAYGGLQKFLWGSENSTMTYDEWKKQNAARLASITDEKTLRAMYDQETKQQGFFTGDALGAAMAETGIGALSSAANIFEQRDNQGMKPSDFYKKANADNLYGVSENLVSRGIATPNASIGMNEFPYKQTPPVGVARYGGQYREGGVYHLTEDEIRQIVANGGEIEYI